MAMHKGTMLLLLLSMISLIRTKPAPKFSTEFLHDIKEAKKRIKDCPEDCHIKVEPKCQCHQFSPALVQGCKPDYFKAGLKTEQLLAHRVDSWPMAYYEELGLQCETELSPLMFLQKLTEVFQGLNNLSRK